MDVHQLNQQDCGEGSKRSADINPIEQGIKSAMLKDTSQKLIYAINKQNDATERNFLAWILRHRQSSVLKQRDFAVLLLRNPSLSGIELMN